MKRKYIYSSVVALALLTTSCEKAEPTLEGDGGASDSGSTFSITIAAPTQPEGTRVGMNDLNTEWTVGDGMTFFAYDDNVANLNTAAGFGHFSASSVAADGAATFTGTFASAMVGQKICGFYPGEKAYMNNTNTGVRFLSTLLLAQPTYFKLEYEDGLVTPSSMGQYSYLYFTSDQTLSSTSSASTTLTGTYKHIMGYLDFNFTGVSGAVERVYVTSTLPVMEEAKVDTDGNITCDRALDYAITTEGDDSDSAVSKLSKFQIEDFIFTLTDSDTGELGVTPADGTLRVRLPIFPQTLLGNLDVYVVYTDGTESVVTLNVSGMTVESGKRYFNDQVIPLTTTQTANPKIGDYFWNDGTSSFSLEGKSTPPDGIAYDWAGTGASRTAGRTFSPTYYRGATYIGADYINDSSNNKNTLLINQTDMNGICAMQTLMNLAIEPSQSNGGNIFSQYSGTEELASTYSAHINSLIPAMGLAYDKSTDASYTDAVYSKSYTGKETYLWYVPTVYELYELYARINAVQALDENFYVSQQIAIYDAGLYGVTKTSSVEWGRGKLAVPSSTASSVAITDNTTVGPFFDSIIPAYGTAAYSGSSIAAHNVNMRTATMRSDQPGAGYYVNLGNIYELIAITTANYYYGYSGYWNNNTGNTNPTWSIMCVDADGATPNN
ncbi:MAG: hypothetical protein R3Y68_00625 [Rikenellaceae bacterium]